MALNSFVILSLSLGCQNTYLTQQTKAFKISQVFLEWCSAKDILYALSDCRRKALSIFSNKGKINAICDIISRVATESFKKIKTHIQIQGLEYVQQFPYIGPVTGLHLLKNIGFPISKPDRHLVRIADATGYETVQDLCESIKKETGDDVSEVDIVLWRYATLRRDYISHFKESAI